ncbi:FMN-binding glutamate synthase family protein [Paraneptunicella aestuarii]|uniref:FMN-binding glutamate synthase family protein n=1 Tax=Paraneptunicella aestuarii TaxID=2831148 RepID=UPI001E2E9FE5|nr:FMN-binding glutamate synthase family protein [Paraneptunicella aestuarii]UAA37427.1 FMN-binding glutamate synthase family protein [Paraneptunicella aestuarii]
MATHFSDSWLYPVVEIFVVLFIAAVGLITLLIITFYFIDITQKTHTIRRNYPVLGRFRYFFEHMGGFFRQYFFAMDREELPFNRADRSWVYRAAKNSINTVPFGSTRDLRPVGSIFFVNCPYPSLSKDSVTHSDLQVGPYCQIPYNACSIINISAMSYGALSVPAIRALSRGAKKGGCWMNTGEGGLSPYHLEGGCDIIFQIGTAKFGVRDKEGNLSEDKLRAIAGHEQVRMFEIKLSQGAKPGKGGILPGSKVTAEIAKIRGIEEGQDAISPNRHIDIANTNELLDSIAKIREITGKPVGFKTVFGEYRWFEEMLEEINRRGIESAPDFITIDSADGGTGAAPATLIDYVGLPIKESLPVVVDLLNKHHLRNRIKVICSGKLITPAGVAWALAVGADFINSARGFMFSLGCIQALQCNKNTCPTGITTHDPKLQRGLDVEEKSERVANYIRNMNYEVGVLAHSCGVSDPRELKRHHVRMVVENGRSVALNELYPEEL